MPCPPSLQPPSSNQADSRDSKAFLMTPACPVLLGFFFFFKFLCGRSLWPVALVTAGPKRQRIYGKPGEQQSRDAFPQPSVGNLFLNDLSVIYGSQ